MSDKADLSPHQIHISILGPNIGYDDRVREHFIVIENHDDACVCQEIRFCPLCGIEFPQSLRSSWFDRLLAIGIDPMNDSIPDPYSNGSWWKQEGL